MRVLQITAFSGWGCTGRIAVGIHNALEASGHESAIAWGRTNTAPDSIRTIKISNALDQIIHGLYTRITDKCGFASVKATKEFIREIDEYNPDIIQMHILHGYYINLEILFDYIQERAIPVVWTFHDCWAFTGHCPYFDYVQCEKWKTGCHNCQQKSHHPTSWLLDNSKWNWNRKKDLFTKQNMTIVTPSEWLAELVKESFLKDCNITVINNGIDLNNFKPTTGLLIKKLGLEDKKIVLGVSSTWVKSKGIEDFYALANILPEEYQVVLVGLSEKQISALPSNIVGVERTDSVQQLAELYTAATVFVNPTYEDNYPTTNVEAIACGTPVVTYLTGGSAEIVEKSGMGAIVNQGDIIGLKNAVLEADKKVYQLLNLHELCSQECAFKKYVDLYSDILKSQEKKKHSAKI